jgi:membrane-bound serine protease (ClpP class)
MFGVVFLMFRFSILSCVRNPGRWVAVLATVLSVIVGSVLPAQTRPDDVPAALVVRVEGEIDTATVALLQRAMATVTKTGAQYLVLDIFSTQSTIEEVRVVGQLLNNLQSEDLSVVAFIGESAFPAAAMLALACDQVYMRSGAQIGGGVLSMEADFTPLREAMLRSIATTTRDSKGRQLLVQGMVDKEMILWDATYRDDSAAGSGLEQRGFLEDARLKKMQSNPKIDFVVSPSQFVQPLTLKAAEAADVGLIDGVVDTVEILIEERLGLDSTQIGYVEPNWSEDIVSWLNSMREVLYVLGFILLLIEFKTPGFALPGILGVMMFGFAFFGSYMVGLASITEVLLFFLGLGLLAVEIYVMPGMIVFGITGFLCIVAGLIFSQQEFYFPQGGDQSAVFLNNLVDFGLVMLCVMVGIWVVYANLDRIPLLKNAIQAPPQPGDDSAGGLGDHEQALSLLVQAEGVVATALRPSGVMLIGDERYDVVSEGHFVDEGSAVRVVAVHGNRVVVVPVDDANSEGGEITIPLLAFMVLVGLALVVAEVFFVSAGILAVMAGTILVSAVFFAFSHHDAVTGWLFLVTCAIGVPMAVKYAFIVLPRTRIGKQLYLSGSDTEEVSGAAQQDGLEALLGTRGTALCDLRPAGYASIGGRRIDVVTRGELIEKSSEIQVIKIESNQVFVSLTQP